MFANTISNEIVVSYPDSSHKFNLSSQADRQIQAQISLAAAELKGIEDPYQSFPCFCYASSDNWKVIFYLTKESDTHYFYTANYHSAGFFIANADVSIPKWIQTKKPWLLY